MPQKPPYSYSPITIPLLPPLQTTTYDIPAPVILFHPPGSDPTTLLNPNPYHPRQTASPMDVDLCLAASMKDEIVAYKVDLTASEHAGVSLSGATRMVSAAPDYAANSAVVAPQKVEDLVATKTETKNNSFNVSDVCNVTDNNEMTLVNKYVDGKIVIKSSQNPTGSSSSTQETSTPVANDTLVQEKKDRVLDITEMVLDSTANKNDTLEQGSEKKNQVSNSTEMLLDSTAIKQEISSSDENDTLVQQPEKKNEDLLRKEAALNSLFICAIPEPGREYQKIVTVEQMDVSLLKMGGKQHGEIWCEICKVNCSSIKNYNTHQAGKKHIKNLQKLEKVPNPLPAMPLTENLKPTKGEVVNPNEGDSTKCELCGVCCSSRASLKEHISGKKHQTNLKLFDTQRVLTPARVTEAPSPEPMYEEGEIVFSESRKRKGNESWTSEEDADSKRQKRNEKEECCVLVACKGCNVVCNGLEAYKTHSCRF